MAKSLRNLSLIAILLFAIFSTQTAYAQLTGTKNIPGDYATLDAAITDLNTLGVGAGGVVLNVVAANPQSAPAGGYSITATGTVANPITITGNSNTITASGSLVAGNLNDGIFKLIGSDYVTIQGFTMLENAANLTTTAGTNNMTEWGVALLYATATDGAQNCTIQNNTITLNRTYQNTFGIYSNSTHTATAVTTSATATGSTGGNSGLRIYGNSIDNINNGIVIVGPTAIADANTGIDVGGSSLVQGNVITNYGTTGTFSGYANVSGTVNGILIRNSNGFNCSYNTVTSSVGGVTAGTLNGIQVPASSSTPTATFTNNITFNSISLKSGLIAGAMTGISYPGGSASITSVLNINNNDFNNFGHTVAGTGAIIFITVASTNLTTSINNNTFTNINVNTTGSVTFIVQTFSNTLAGGSKTVNGNSIVTGFTKTGAGGTILLVSDNGSSTNVVQSNCQNNNFSNITLTGATTLTGLNYTDGGTAPSRTVSGNTLNNWTGGTSTINCMNFTYWSGSTSTLNTNTITNITGQGAITGITIGNSALTANPMSVSNNTINNLSSTGTGGAVTGIACANASPTVNLNGNTINTLSSTGASAVSGITVTAAGASSNVFKNKIYDLAGSNATSTVNGILISAATTSAGVNVYDNLIGDLRAPNATSATDAIRGINMTGAATTGSYNLSFNSIYINATSVGANFSTSGIFHTTSATATTSALNMRGNLVINLSTANGTGITSAYRRSSTTLTNYGSVSNYNLFYTGTPSATNLIFYDGTNSDQTLSAFQTRVSPREAQSVTESPTFMSTTGSSANFLKPDSTIFTFTESGATVVGGITTDFNGVARYPNSGYPNNLSYPAYNPDIGAHEFGGKWNDVAGPIISYTTLLNTANTGNRNLTATVTDPSGVAGGANLPRLYYKKSSEGSYHFDDAPSILVDSYTWTMNAAAMGGLAVTDVVQYYVAAQDLNGFTSTSPSGGSGSNPPGTVAPGAPNTYTILDPPLSGTYTVGLALFNRVSGLNLYTEERTRKVTVEESVTEDNAIVQKTGKESQTSSMYAPNVKTQTVTKDEKYSVLMQNGQEYRGSGYHELTKAERSSLGLSTDMVGAYTTITAAITDVNTRGVSGNTTLSLTDPTYPTETFPLVVNITSEALPSGSAGITIKPASGITTIISGSAASAGLIKILNNYVTIDGSNTIGGTSKDMTITNIAGTGPSVVHFASTGTNYLTNCALKNCIIINGLSTSTALVVSDAILGTAGYFNNITIQNNDVQKAYIGMYLIGNVASTSFASVIGNVMTTPGANQIRFTGIYMQQLNGALVSQNVFTNFEGITAEDDNGVWFATGMTNSIIERNYVGTLKYTGTGGYGTHGVQISTATAACNITVRNNQFCDLSGDGWVNTILGDNTHGIYAFTAQTGLKLYNNSINLNGNTLNQTGSMSYGITLGTGTTADIRNNNIVNNLGLLAATGLGSTCIFLQTGVSQLEASDNNNYYCAPTGSGLKNVGYVSATSYSTVATYAAATAKDAHSVGGDPAYLSALSGDVDGTNPNCWVVNGNGVNGLVTDDYLGNPRPTIATGVCDIGAFNVIPSVAAPNATQTGTIGAGNTTTYSIFGRTFASILWGPAGTFPGTLTAVFNSGDTPPNPPGGARYGYGYWSFTPDAQPSGGATYDITVFFDDSQTGTILTPSTNLILAKYDGAIWTDYQPGVGAGQSNLNYAGKSITVAGLSSFSSFALTDKDAPLPVELSSFSAAVNRRIVNLNWSTVSEVNNSGFEIERKEAASQSYSKIGFVQGNGTTNSTKNYTFEDRNLVTGKYNYRLKQMDYNGNYKYYELSSLVDVGVPSKFEISQNYPNPFNPSTKINFDLPFDSKVQIKIFDMTGKEMAQIVNESRAAGYYTVQFNASALSSGIYFYQINAAGGNQSFVKTMKMVLVK